MLDIDELDPARLPQRKSKSDCVEWSVVAARLMVCGVGHNEALDRTMSAIGKILIDPVNGKAISDIDGQSDRDDVANRMFLRRVNVPVVPLLKTSYPQLESSHFKRSYVQFSVKGCARGVRNRVLQRATRICRYSLCSSLLSAIEEIKSSLVAHGMPCGFVDLDCDSHSIEKNANTLWKSKTIIWKVQVSVKRRPLSLTQERSLVWSLRSGQWGNTVLIFLLLVNGTWI